MLFEVQEAFAAFGLTLNLGKTNFTNTAACEGESLELSGHVVKWSPRLMGTVITLCGNDDEAIRARMQRALRSFEVWSPMLTNTVLLVAARVAASVASVLSSYCWQAQNWTPTKKRYSFMSSWFARFGSSMRGLRRCPDEPIDSWCRHGKELWTELSVDVVRAVKTANVRFAGHTARMPT